MTTAPRRFRLLVIGALLLRAVIVVTTVGSNDVGIFLFLGETVSTDGLVGAYDQTSYANHPPLPLLYAAWASTLTGQAVIPFSWLIKLPGLVGDGLAVLAIRELVRGWDPSRRRAAVLAYLYSPVAIILGSFHGNTDLLYVALVAWACVWVARGRPGVVGLLLGLAVNVKLLAIVPAAAVAAVVLRRRRQVPRFLLGGLLGSAPLVALLLANPTVTFNILGYQPPAWLWGVSGIELLTLGTDLYAVVGRPVLALGLVAVVGRQVRRGADVVTCAAAAGLAFLVLTPGFGVQYLAIPLPFLVVVDRRQAWRFGIAGGFLLVAAYGSYVRTWFPLWVQLGGIADSSTTVVVSITLAGLAAWLVSALALRGITTSREAPTGPGAELRDRPELPTG